MLMKKTQNCKLKIGYNTSCSDIGKACFDALAEKVDFLFCHFDFNNKTAAEECNRAKELSEKITGLDKEFIINFEQANFCYDLKSADGHDWANHPDGTHRTELTDELIDAFCSSGKFIGFAHDEMEHCIINRNKSIWLSSKGKKDIPFFVNSVDKDVLSQGELLSRQLGEYSERMKRGRNISFAGEHVFPVLFHTFARNGIIPNFKSQKESFSDVQYAVAAGAALEYGTELWNCVDLWFRMTCPGHSHAEMFNNLLFSYLAGVNRVYVEHVHHFVDENENLTDYGRAFLKFSDEFREKDRDYTVRDLTPEIAIIRYDDTFWGQGDPYMWWPCLFGNKKIHPDRRAREYIRAFRTITHGETGRGGISWNRLGLWFLRKHRSFATLNNAVVFDDRVTKDKLLSLKLCFLCGYHISSDTLSSVESLVRENGLTVVTSKRFLPGRLKKSKSRDITDGRGRWIVTNNMNSLYVRKAVRPFIGEKGKIRLTFGDKTVCLKISPDGNEIAEA